MLQRVLQNLILISLVAGLIFLGTWFNFLLTPIVSGSAGLRFELRPGTSFKTLTENLKQQGLIKHPFFFGVLAHLHGNQDALKAGVYLIRRGTTPGQLLKQLTSGTGLLYHAFTIIPGWRFQQLRTALAQEEKLVPTIQGKSDSEVMHLLGSAQGSPEGEFFPETYYYHEGSSDLKLLSRAYQQMQMKLQEAWLKRGPSLSFKSPYEALIAASLVEKEAHLSAERPVIAGVLLNRLAKKMPLQFDPTIVYGLHQWEQTHPGPSLGFSGKIRKLDLKIDTPYNTYLHKGLPPTPIAMPSWNALNAVLHPVNHAFFYFVATGSGAHQFSTTLEAHHVAVLMMRFHEQGFYNVLWVRAYLLKYLLGRDPMMGQLNVIP